MLPPNSNLCLSKHRSPSILYVVTNFKKLNAFSVACSLTVIPNTSLPIFTSVLDITGIHKTTNFWISACTVRLKALTIRTSWSWDILSLSLSRRGSLHFLQESLSTISFLCATKNWIGGGGSNEAGYQVENIYLHALSGVVVWWWWWWWC